MAALQNRSPPYLCSTTPDLSADEETEAIVEAKETTNAELVGANHEFDDVVAIVDPPRAGLHRHVLSALRRENRLKRLVYVSCNANTMATNVIDLCVPQGADGNGGGVPFTPVKALASRFISAHRTRRGRPLARAMNIVENDGDDATTLTL